MFLFDLLLLYPSWAYFSAVCFGLIIGSFLNVYIYRFHTGKSLTGNSHCLSCATSLKWYELFPVISFLCLKGRCRTCGCKIPPRYAIVEICTAILFALSLAQAASVVELLVVWVIMAILVVIVMYDINHFIIPDGLVVSLTGILFSWFGYEFWLGSSINYIFQDMYAALAGSGFFLFLWLISKGRWLGFGDVKLAFPLGLLVGSTYVFSMIVLSFWIGAAISLTLIGLEKLQRGKLGLRFGTERLTIKSIVPFAPFLVAGCLLVFFTKLNVITLFSFL